MDVDEDSLIGEPLDEAPKQDPIDDACMGRRWEKDEDDVQIFQGYCRAWPGKGTDHVGEGRCSKHGGSAGAPEGNSNAEGNDGGAPEGNQNAADHSLYSDENLYYQNVVDDAGRALIDDIYEGYYERYVDRHGEEPPRGDDLLIFKIAVTEHKILSADDWPDMRPPEMDAGHPLLDRQEKRTAQGEPYFEIVESAVLKAESRLANLVKKWIKKLSLEPGEDDASKVDAGVVAKMWDDLTSYYEED
jgi:hypothetical protein